MDYSLESMGSMVKNATKTYNIITVNRKYAEHLMQMKPVFTYTYICTHLNPHT